MTEKTETTAKDKDGDRYVYAWNDTIEFSPFVNAVLSYIYGTMKQETRGSVIGITLGWPKHHEGFSTRVARINTKSVGGRHNYFYVGFRVSHEGLSDWKPEFKSLPIGERLRPPTDKEIVWL